MSCNRFVEVWGSAEGKIKKLSPHIRLLAGFTFFIGIFISDQAKTGGLLLTLAIVLGWYLMVKPPALLKKPLLIFSLILFLPFLIFTPFIDTSMPAEKLLVPMPYAVVWRLIIHGMGALFVSVWTFSTVSLFELEQAFGKLKIPRPICELVLQIIHQSHALALEARNITQAIKIRGAVEGYRNTIAMAASVPQVWLMRILYRAEKVGEAMQIRGYQFIEDEQSETKITEYLYLSFSLAIAGLAVFLRVTGN